jgi:hypothetical protein
MGMSEPRLTRVKRALLGGAIGVVISVATLVILEGAASDLLFVRDYRTAAPPKGFIRPHTTHDTLLGWANKPSFSSPDEYGKGIGLTTTAEGFRGTGAADTAAGARREGLVCSGDSYTMGYGVSDDHAWCAELARTGGYRTINMGQIDYGLDQIFLWYRRDGALAIAQIQVLAITNGELERMMMASNGGRFKPMLALDGNSLVAKNVPVQRQTSEALRRSVASHTKDDLRILQLVRTIPGLDSRVNDARRIDGQWALVDRVLDELLAIDKAHGSHLVLAYLPTKRDLKPSFIDARRQRLEDYSRRRGVTFVDLTPAMRALRPDSLDLAFISRVPRGSAPGVANQYSNLGNMWVAHMLATRLAAQVVADAR